MAPRVTMVCLYSVIHSQRSVRLPHAAWDSPLLLLTLIWRYLPNMLVCLNAYSYPKRYYPSFPSVPFTSRNFLSLPLLPVFSLCFPCFVLSTFPSTSPSTSLSKSPNPIIRQAGRVRCISIPFRSVRAIISYLGSRSPNTSPDTSHNMYVP
eukprot:sb/3473504/